MECVNDCFGRWWLQLQALEESAEALRERCTQFHKGCYKYTYDFTLASAFGCASRAVNSFSARNKGGHVVVLTRMFIFVVLMFSIMKLQ
jgi:hypothetical protein